MMTRRQPIRTHIMTHRSPLPPNARLQQDTRMSNVNAGRGRHSLIDRQPVIPSGKNNGEPPGSIVSRKAPVTRGIPAVAMKEMDSVGLSDWMLTSPEAPGASEGLPTAHEALEVPSGFKRSFSSITRPPTQPTSPPSRAEQRWHAGGRLAWRIEHVAWATAAGPWTPRY
ncbi:hypothetical protein EJ02DRAFT_482601 [Clathrospora elynae]|uniref:Uncharacterized protein n=1 Tax=Clathrospora elynae TaxID=706981 RepID=A0A6A5SVP5_9PLEO|nr:hypothetical protein EJ02DRAFT_482601 [Clathrospora elynae]